MVCTAKAMAQYKSSPNISPDKSEVSDGGGWVGGWVGGWGGLTVNWNPPPYPSIRGPKQTGGWRSWGTAGGGQAGDESTLPFGGLPSCSHFTTDVQLYSARTPAVMALPLCKCLCLCAAVLPPPLHCSALHGTVWESMPLRCVHLHSAHRIRCPFGCERLVERILVPR